MDMIKTILQTYFNMNRIIFFTAFLILPILIILSIMFGSLPFIIFCFLLPFVLMAIYFPLQSVYFNIEEKEKEKFYYERSSIKNIHFFWPFSYFKLKKIHYINTNKTYYVLDKLVDSNKVNVYRQDMFCITLIKQLSYTNIKFLKEKIKTAIEDDNIYKSDSEEQKEFKEWNGALDKASNRNKIIEDIT